MSHRYLTYSQPAVNRRQCLFPAAAPTAFDWASDPNFLALVRTKGPHFLVALYAERNQLKICLKMYFLAQLIALGKLTLHVYTS